MVYHIRKAPASKKAPVVDRRKPKDGVKVTHRRLPSYATLDDVVTRMRPVNSVQCYHPERLVTAARTFVEKFPGLSFYAVKSNPDPYVLRHLYAEGIRHFDVASLGEIRLIHALFPNAQMAYLNPVKSRESVRAAYRDYGVRDFVVDTLDEMNKVAEETAFARDLTLIVRVAMPKGSAACALVSKFGCTPAEGVVLLQEAARRVDKVGVSFHVGSQTVDPQSYADAICTAGAMMHQSGVTLSVFDVGGGFPAPDMGMDVPPLERFFEVIGSSIAALNLPKDCAVWCEPGRGLSGACSTLLVRVELRKNDVLYINDGSYGNLFEVALCNWSNKVRVVGASAHASAPLTPFRFYGPTCDSIDHMKGPFFLPDSIQEGDWIAIESAGSYTNASRSGFNGFYSDAQVEIVAPSCVSSGDFLKVVC